MQEQIRQLEIQVQELQSRLDSLSYDQELKGKLDDMQVERVFNAITTGTPTTNDLLMTITDSNGDTATTFSYPTRIMIYTWKGQRLAIPVYDATNILYP